MAQTPDGKTIIIVKKVVGHGGAHGSSWKVAFADFMTSMMCFFLVMWLVNSASAPTRSKIASYFRTPGIFEKGSGTPLELGGAGILPDAFAPPADGNARISPDNKIYEAPIDKGRKVDAFGKGGGDGQQAQGAPDLKGKGEQEKMEEVAAQINKAIQQNQRAISGFIGQMNVKVDERGLHLEIMDTPTASMFTRGSSSILPEAEKELAKIAAILKVLPNPIDIEGHTDAAPYRGRAAEAKDNWMLSTERANAARKILQSAGVKDDQIARVVGYAAQRLKVPSDPLAAPNRRISISMRYTAHAAEALAGTPVVETRPVPIRKPGEAAGERRETAPGQRPAEAAPGTQVPPRPAAKNGLAVEVFSTGPEAAQPPAPEASKPRESSEPPARPLWMEKDKIFGDKNPFFGE